MSAIDRFRPVVPATADDWAHFLRPMLAALNQQPTREQFQARCAAIAFAVPDVPASMLVPWRQRDAMRTFKFLPSPAEIAEWIGPAIREERERMDRHARLAAPSDLPAAPPPRTPEEIAAVQAKARAVMAAATREGAPHAIAAGRRAPLSDGALLAHYDRAAAEGNDVAAFRARVIRQRMGEAAYG